MDQYSTFPPMFGKEVHFFSLSSVELEFVICKGKRLSVPCIQGSKLKKKKKMPGPISCPEKENPHI